MKGMLATIAEATAETQMISSVASSKLSPARLLTDSAMSWIRPTSWMPPTIMNRLMKNTRVVQSTSRSISFTLGCTQSSSAVEPRMATTAGGMWNRSATKNRMSVMPKMSSDLLSRTESVMRESASSGAARAAEGALLSRSNSERYSRWVITSRITILIREMGSMLTRNWLKVRPT